MSWKPIVAKRFSVTEFPGYVQSLRWTTWRPNFIVLHNTAVPSLSQRPSGLTLQHIRNLEAYYRDTQGWPSGPHAFVDDVDDGGIWIFTPLVTPGTHSPSWNGSSLGIEMLGDFSRESFTDGRGLAVRKNVVIAMAALNNALGLRAEGFKFHVEDPRTSHDCPGIRARSCRPQLIEEIRVAMGSKASSAPAAGGGWLATIFKWLRNH